MRRRAVTFAFAAFFATPAAYAWEAATPAWCGSGTVAASTDTGVVVLSAGRTRTIPLGAAPHTLRFSPDCSKLAIVADRVLSLDVVSGALTNLGVVAAARSVNAHVPLSWSPSMHRFAATFFSGRTRGADVVIIYDPGSATSKTLALPPAEVDDVALTGDDDALVSLKIGNIFGPDSLVTATSIGFRAITTTTYPRLFVTPTIAVAQTSSGIVTIDGHSGAVRSLSSRATLRGLSSDGTAAILAPTVGSGNTTSLTISTGVSRSFKLDSYEPAPDARGLLIAGVPLTRTGPAATRYVLMVDDGAALPRVIFDAGPLGWKKAIKHVAVAPDGSRVAFVLMTRSANHAVAVCGDWSWDESYELVIAQIATSAAPTSRTFLATSTGCAYE